MKNLISVSIIAGALCAVLGIMAKVFTAAIKLFGVRGVSYIEFAAVCPLFAIALELHPCNKN